MDILTFYATVILSTYESEDDLKDDIESGQYDPRIYQDLADKESQVVITLRLEKGEAKVMFSEGSTWFVWFTDILNRWYTENTAFFDKEVDNLLSLR